LFTKSRNDLSGTGRKWPFPRTKTAETARKRSKPAGNGHFPVAFALPCSARAVPADPLPIRPPGAPEGPICRCPTRLPPHLDYVDLPA
jgi:hypothetical protein